VIFPRSQYKQIREQLFGYPSQTSSGEELELSTRLIPLEMIILIFVQSDVLIHKQWYAITSRLYVEIHKIILEWRGLWKTALEISLLHGRLQIIKIHHLLWQFF
jgi:hypothetical protein